ncbi:MAG: T9SS type A sorting domain-containing protein [Saprospiraceae bacterium]
MDINGADVMARSRGLIRFRALWATNDYWLDIDNITILPNEVTTSTTEVLTNIADFRLFPNPTTGQTQITLSLIKRASIFLQVLNMTGQIIFEEQYSSSHQFNQFVDLSNFPDGIYLVKIRLNEQNISRKFIKVD